MKRWFYARFLPMWAKETLLKDYRILRRENARLRRQLREKEAYIQGMHKGMGKERILRCAAALLAQSDKEKYSQLSILNSKVEVKNEHL